MSDDINALKYLLSDLERPSLQHIAKKLIERSNQLDYQYKNKCLEITKTKDSELLDLKLETIRLKAECAAYLTILGSYFNQNTLIRNIETLSKKGEE